MCQEFVSGKWREKCAYLAYFHHHVYHVYMYTPEEAVAVGETREMKIFFVPQTFYFFTLSYFHHTNFL